MEWIVFVLLSIIIIFIYKNIILIKDYFISKQYRKIYKLVLLNDPSSKEKINEYISSEKNPYFVNKAYVLLMYVKLRKNEDIKRELDKIDYKVIFLRNNKYDINNVNYNSDVFIWSMCCLPLIYKQGYLSFIMYKMKLLESYLSRHVEYKSFMSCCSLLNEDEEGYKFLEDLVNNKYDNLEYDSSLLNVTQRISLAFIASLNKKKNIEYVDELKILSTTYLGKNLLSDFNIYEVYK